MSTVDDADANKTEATRAEAELAEAEQTESVGVVRHDSRAADSGDAIHNARLCARVGCGQQAVATLTADYDDRMMAVGSLSPVREPPALDLCAPHRSALKPPEGWTLITHEGTGIDHA